MLDSCTNFKLYVDRAVELGQKAICFSEHEMILNAVEKKMYCDKQGIKMLYGVETYLTRTHDEKIRDNFHTILISKNDDGMRELNTLMDIASQDDHKYYKSRISFDEFLSISPNIIKISACLASPLAQVPRDDPYFDKLCRHYDYFEIQPHVNSDDQKRFNLLLVDLANEYDKPLIAGTDTHSLDAYKAECRTIRQVSKHIIFSDEDKFDLTYKAYNEVVDMFEQQGVLPAQVYLEALENTNRMADSVSDYTLDTTFKYPKLYDNEEQVFWEMIQKSYADKLQRGVIQDNPQYMENITEELRVFKKVGMIGFMLFMGELSQWCDQNDIPRGPCRGSVGGSTIAYIIDVIDLDPVVWHTVFSRFCNEDRVEIGDIDIDIAPAQRQLVYDYIIQRFGQDYTAYILTTGTVAEKGTIDEIGRALNYYWCEDNKGKEEKSPYSLKNIDKIKDEYAADPEQTKAKHPDIFYYFDGVLGTVVSRGVHPAGIIISPVTLPDNYGTVWYDGKRVSCINMEEIHEISLVKYDLLGLKNIGIIKTCCELLGIHYPKSHEVVWDDSDVYHDMVTSPVGIFQFEQNYAFECLKKFVPTCVNDMTMVTSAIRPSGESYRDRLLSRQINHNPSVIIDELLADNNGFLLYQEDTINFLKDICGLSGGEADNIRRAIGRKDAERLEAALPRILDGYCRMSDQPKEVAEEEAKEFLRIIEDSSRYQFGFNHATGYSMIGYLCAYFRYYHPAEFVTALLNNADNPDDISDATTLARLKHINIHSPKFGKAIAEYTLDADGSIYKGVASIKFLNEKVATQLYDLAHQRELTSFMDVLMALHDTEINSKQLSILIMLDYFSDYGNSCLLNNILAVFNFFKDGEAKTVKREEFYPEPLRADIILKYTNGVGKTGKELTRLTIMDMCAILREHEQYLRGLTIAEYPVAYRVKAQLEYLGYISPTMREEDRPILMVQELYPLYRKKDHKLFGYSAVCTSIGSGVTTRFTIFSETFKNNPVVKGDIIECMAYKRDGKYFRMTGYEVIE